MTDRGPSRPAPGLPRTPPSGGLKGHDMRHANRWWLLSVAAVAFMTLVGAAGSALAQDKPRYGGELQFVVPSEPPSYDAHREETFGAPHPMSPHYHTLPPVAHS